jgi:hypothetical protein
VREAQRPPRELLPTGRRRPLRLLAVVLLELLLQLLAQKLQELQV